MLRIYLISVLFYFLQAGAYGQLPAFFTDESTRYPGIQPSGYSIAIADINGDYRDDIIHSDKDSVYLSVQLNNGGLFENWSAFPTGFDILTTNVSDIDNDGINELIVSGNRTGIHVYGYNRDLYQFEPLFSQASQAYAQGSSVADLNGDGLLDFFVSNDVGYNQVYLNDGAQLSASLFNDQFNVLNPSSSSGNYNAIWFDPDLDGDQDLFVSKCHVNASSFSDPRRINQFFINEEGEFIESATEWNLGHGDQSWCASAGDLDNDGDPDLLLINHGSPIMLLENVEGASFATHERFVDNKELLGDEQQVVIADFNNDGLLDAFIFGFDDQLLINQGGLRFTSYPFVLGTGNAYSGAVGDFNNDGWLDLYTVYGVAGSAIQDRIWMNFSMSNHWLKLSLRGQESNTPGIGARIEVFAGNEVMTRFVQSGESYGISNSMNIHFGLGDLTVLDSVVCYWPSGQKDSYFDIEADKHYILNEGLCMMELGSLQPSADALDCSNQSIDLTTSTTGHWLWPDGSVGDVFQLSAPGIYQAQDSEACFNTTGYVRIHELPDLDTPMIYGAGLVRLCAGQNYSLSAEGQRDLLWNTGSIAEELSINESGIYYAYTTVLCDTLYSDSLHIEFRALDTATRRRIFNTEGMYQLEVGDVVSRFDSQGAFIEESDLLEVSISSDSLFYF